MEVSKTRLRPSEWRRGVLVRSQDDGDLESEDSDGDMNIDDDEVSRIRRPPGRCSICMGSQPGSCAMQNEDAMDVEQTHGGLKTAEVSSSHNIRPFSLPSCC